MARAMGRLVGIDIHAADRILDGVPAMPAASATSLFVLHRGNLS
jgi:hypothetical protein